MKTPQQIQAEVDEIVTKIAEHAVLSMGYNEGINIERFKRAFNSELNLVALITERDELLAVGSYDGIIAINKNLSKQVTELDDALKSEHEQHLNVQQERDTLKKQNEDLSRDRERLLNVLEHCALDPDKQPSEQHLVARSVVKEYRGSSITAAMKG